MEVKFISGLNVSVIVNWLVSYLLFTVKYKL